MHRSSAIVTGADDACSGCRELFRANHQEKQSGNAKDRAVDGSTRDGVLVFGGQDDSVLSLLHPQARDLACHYRIGRGDVLRARAESDEAYHVHGALPIQYVADRPDQADEQPFLSENDAAMNKMMADMTIK